MRRDRHIEERILSAAQEEFLIKGFRRASVLSIVTKSGISPFKAHYFLIKKDELFKRLFLQKLGKISATMRILFKTYPTEMLIRKTVEVNFDMFRSQPALARFLYQEMIMDTGQRTHLLRLLNPNLKMLYEQIGKMLSEKILVCEIKPIDPIDLIMNITLINMSTFLMYPDSNKANSTSLRYEACLMRVRESNVQFIINAMRP